MLFLLSRVRAMVYRATVSNISIVADLLAEETRVPGDIHIPVASHRHSLSHNVVSSAHNQERGSKSQL